MTFDFLRAATSGGLMALAFPPVNWGFLAWVALVPLLRAVRLARDVREAANLGATAGLVFFGIHLHWFAQVFGITGGALLLIPALFWAAAAGLTRRAQDDLPAALLPFVTAVVWMGCEYFRGEVWFLRFPWLLAGGSQWNQPSVLQAASLIGVYGLSGLIVGVNAAAADWLPPLSPRSRRVSGVIGLAAAGALVLWGRGAAARWRVLSESGPAVAVAAVQDESYQDLRLAAWTRQAARAAPRPALIVWPEYSTLLPPGREAERIAALRTLARETRASLVIGCVRFLGTKPEAGEGRSGIFSRRKKFENFALVLGPDGREIGRYWKTHPIPIVEAWVRRGTEFPVFDLPAPAPAGRIRAGVQICYDLDGEDGARRVAAGGAELLAVPNLDPQYWGRWQHRLHSAMSVFRAVETRRWIVRAASSGDSQIIDPSGRIRRALGYGEEGVLAGEARLVRGRSWYVRAGWLLPRAALAATVVLLLVALIPRRTA